jgi:transcriptional regulator with XRE-family HTH domain
LTANPLRHTVAGMEALKQPHIVQMLREKMGNMTQRDFAEQIGVSQAYLGDVLKGRRDPGPSILQFLGIEKAYVQASDSQAAD